MRSAITVLIRTNQFDQAKEVSAKQVQYMKTCGEGYTKQYFEDLTNYVKILKTVKDFNEIVKLIPEYLKAAETVFTKNSSEYLKVRKDYVNVLLICGFCIEAYQELIESLDIIMRIHGSDMNRDGIDTLLLMSVTKMKLQKYDEARSIINRCK